MAGRNRTNTVILTGLMMAMTTVATMVIAIPVPFTNGYIHLGDSMIFLSVLLLGWKYGAVAAGIGSALADLFLGYPQWIPWTLFIKGAMAILMGITIMACQRKKRNVILVSVSTALIWLAFHTAVNRIVAYEGSHNPGSLLSETVTNPSELGVFLAGMENKLMLVALLIPVFLLLISLIIRKTEHIVIPIAEIMGMTLAGLFMVFGYYVAGGLLYGNFAVSAFSIPMNMVQFLGGFLVAALIRASLSKTPVNQYFMAKNR